MSSPSTTISTFGLIVGALALLAAIVHFWAGPFTPQPTLEQSVAEKAVAIKNATIAALKGEEVAPEPTARRYDLDDGLRIGTAVLGGLAIILGVVAFARHESWRAAAGAAALGGAAIAFQFAALALGMIVVAILIVGVLSQIGIEP